MDRGKDAWLRANCWGGHYRASAKGSPASQPLGVVHRGQAHAGQCAGQLLEFPKSFH